MKKLPENLRRKLKKDFPDEKRLVAVDSDITHNGEYGKEWLVITDKTLIVYTTENEKHLNTHLTIKLKSIKNIETRDLVGCGVLDIDTGKKTHQAIIYSNAKNPDFSQAAEKLEELIKKKHKPKKKKDKSKQPRICEKCSLPIPLEMHKCPRCIEKGKIMFRILKFSKPYMNLLFYILLLMLVGTGFGLATPYMSKLFIDFILKPDAVTGVYMYAHWLPMAALILLIAYAGQVFVGGIHERLSGTLGYKTIYDVRANLYEKLQTLSLSYFDKYQTGAILTRVSQDTRELQRLLVDFIPITIESFFTLIGVGVFLFILSWQITLFVLIPIIVTVLFVKNIFPRVFIYFHRLRHRRTLLNVLINDAISGIRVIKSFGQESQEIKKFDVKSIDYRDVGIEVVKKWSVYHPLFHFIIMCGVVIVWFVGGKLVFSGKMTLGSVVAYSGYLMMFYRPITMLTRMVDTITNSLSAADRVFEIIDTEPEIKDRRGAVKIKDKKGKVEFQNVFFGYNKFNPIIKNLSVKIKPNEMIGLVGKSGVGKSTIINLICRLYEINKGKIIIDGIDIRKIKYDDLRKYISIVLQETFLFNGTIYDNIAYARPEATHEEIIDAATKAHAHEFIIKKPDGYDTEVGERGHRLSEGEKQRISIARAILRDSRILILDEATSSVDLETEEKIQKALDALTKNRTTIAIAHRLSTLRNCDRLLIIEDGKIVESGTHEQVLAKKGIFYDLVKIQRKLSSVKTIDG